MSLYSEFFNWQERRTFFVNQCLNYRRMNTYFSLLKEKNSRIHSKLYRREKESYAFDVFIRKSMKQRNTFSSCFQCLLYKIELAFNLTNQLLSFSSKRCDQFYPLWEDQTFFETVLRHLLSFGLLYL
ncbi:hypothetical protein BVwin_03570 [Bartonella vinsonii subsp. berkhoffii str. Winnie]|nr:hypothetical protein BVwin_03570 [Bartonella vinsonii subsp. berkhoffii str. Winnie]